MLTLVMAEFGRPVIDALNSETVNSFKRHIGFDELHLYTDDFSADSPNPSIKLFKRNSAFPDHPREGWRNNDYYKVLGLLNADSEIAVSMDSDMKVLSSEAKTLVDMTQKFGLCVPLNPRFLVKVDGTIGADGGYTVDEDPTKGTALAFNMSPISLCGSSVGARSVLSAYCKEMIERPARGPLVMWRAIWKTGFYPCVLAPQWCVCTQHMGCKNEIMLHIGHDAVKQYYKQK